jgi:putative redox protein
VTDTHILAHISASWAADSPKYRVAMHSGKHQLVADEPEGGGGGNEVPSPTVLWLSGLAACTAVTLRMYSERKGWDLGGVTVEADYVDGEPGHVERRIRFGNTLDDEQRGRMAEIADKTPVTKLVKSGTDIRTTLT